MELEAIDQKVRQGQEPAPFAMAEAGREIQNWQRGGATPPVPSPNKVGTTFFRSARRGGSTL